MANGFEVDANGLLPDMLLAEKVKPPVCGALLLLLLSCEPPPKTRPFPTAPKVFCGTAEKGLGALALAEGGNRRWGVPLRLRRPLGVAVLGQD